MYKITYKNPQSRTYEFDYKCQDCEKEFTVSRTMSDESAVTCECGGDCFRLIRSAPTVHLDPISGDHYGATRKWAKGREKQMDKERHNLKEHGTYK